MSKAMESSAEIIRIKRDGKQLSPEQISTFIDGVVSGSVSKEQISALTMAIFFQGMSFDETVALTRAMAFSGKHLEWDFHPIVDKHSTGGVGDKVSIMLAPLLASCGLYVPMISGRGLGHTGGTLDKLESIPGYNTTPDINLFMSVVEKVGCAIIGQTAELAPADKVIYSVRDVTATVESIPLITASILSKKISAGLDHLVMDIKFGSGAFMSTVEEAKKLATSIIQVGNALGMKTSALLTDMNSPLGRNVGNALEIVEAIEFLKTPAKADKKLKEITIALGAKLLSPAKNINENDANQLLENNLSNGKAFEIFQKMVTALGGSADLCENYGKYLPQAKIITEVKAKKSGYLQYLDNRQIGLLVTRLGGNRQRSNDLIDHSVGLANMAENGKRLERGDKICNIYSSNADLAEEVEKYLHNICHISDKSVSNKQHIIKIDSAS